MNNLPAKQEAAIIHGYHFNQNESKVIKAHDSNLINQLQPNQAKQKIIEALIVAVQTIGQKQKTDEELQFITNDIYDYCNSKFKTLRVDELILAIRFGSFGEYGEDVVHISPKNVIQWVKAYQHGKNKIFTTLKAAKEKQRLKTAENDEIKKRAFWDSFTEFVKDEAETFEITGDLSANGWLICRCLDKIGFKDHLQAPADEKKKLFENQKKVVRAEILEEANKNFMFARIKEVKNESVEEKAVAKCKQIMLKRWFSTCPDFNKIDDYVKSFLK